MKAGVNSGKKQRLKLQVARSTQRSTSRRTPSDSVTIESTPAHDFRLKGVPTDLFTVFHVREAQYEVDKRIVAARQPLPRRAAHHEDLQLYQQLIDIPTRPPWHESTKARRLQEAEEAAFESYLTGLYAQYPPTRLNHFEHNLQVWRQLWRVCEMSDTLVISADARHPLFHFPPSLFRYVRAMGKEAVLVLNKVDLIDGDTLRGWVEWFAKKYPELDVVCFSSFPNGEAVVSDGVDADKKRRVKREGGKRTPAGVKELTQLLERKLREKLERAKHAEKAKAEEERKEDRENVGNEPTAAHLPKSRGRSREKTPAPPTAAAKESERTEGPDTDERSNGSERTATTKAGADDAGTMMLPAQVSAEASPPAAAQRPSRQKARLTASAGATAAAVPPSGDGVAAAAATPSDTGEDAEAESEDEDELVTLHAAAPVRPSRASILIVGVIGHPNAGKCFARGTRVRLFDGQTIAVEHVVPGLKLMGDDGLPRIVSPGSLTQGRDALYRITPKWTAAQPFTVNGDHILVLVNNTAPFASKRSDTGSWRVIWWELNTDNCMVQRSSSFPTEDEAVDSVEALMLAGWQPLEWEVSVRHLLTSPRSTELLRHCFLVACKAITFSNPLLPSLQQVLTQALGFAPSTAQLEYMAWWLGMWVTDGSSDRPTISQGGSPAIDARGVHHADSHDDIVARLHAYAALFNASPIVPRFDKVSTAGWDAWYYDYGVDSVAGRVLRLYWLLQNKHIPQALICDSVDVRQRLLAGVIDGDGHYERDKNYYELPAKERLVIDGYKELAATLGLRNGAIAPKTYTDKKTGKEHSGHRFNVSGNMWDVVQYCAATYKRCPPPVIADRYRSNESRCIAFSIAPVGEGDYFGFAVHGGVNQRFLLEDYTITHNVALTQPSSTSPSCPPSRLSDSSFSSLCCRGKSSLLNSLFGRMVVSASDTPGHTKHLQTLALTPTIAVVDSPGLVFPAVDMPRELQALCGIFPLQQLREPYSAIAYLAERVPIERVYGLKREREEEVEGRRKGARPADDEEVREVGRVLEVEEEREWSAWELCEAYARQRNFSIAGSGGRVDTHKAAVEMLQDVLSGAVVFNFKPPPLDGDKAVQ